MKAKYICSRNSYELLRNSECSNQMALEFGTGIVLLFASLTKLATDSKMFWLVQFFVPDQKFIYIHVVAFTNILCQTKRQFAFSKIGFCTSTKFFEEALNAVKFLGWLKIFGPAQNILGPVKGQGISNT